VEIEADTPKLQELIDPTAPLDITVHDGFEFWGWKTPTR